jgi:hypothetical protein
MKDITFSQTKGLKKDREVLNKLFSGEPIPVNSFNGESGFYNILGNKSDYFTNKQVNAKQFMLLEPIIYFEANGEYVTIVLPGVLHDYASKAFLKATGKFSTPAIIHDSLYGSHIVSRETADEIFYNAMLSTGTAKYRALSYWAVVRAVGGLAAYNSIDEESQIKARKFIHRIKRSEFTDVKNFVWNNNKVKIEKK